MHTKLQPGDAQVTIPAIAAMTYQMYRDGGRAGM